MPTNTYTVERSSREEYDAALAELEAGIDESVSFLQAGLYGALQEQSGKPVIYTVVRQENGQTVACALAIKYSAPHGMSFLYCPYGPTASRWSPELIDQLQDFFRPIAQELDCSFIRFDVDDSSSDIWLRHVSDKTARTASLQPRAEWVLNISPAEDELWMGFHKHARYNVRLAERADARIEIFSPSTAPLDAFYDLMRTTGERDSFSIFDREYYRSYLETLADDEGFMVVCTIDDKPAAVGLFVLHDRQAHYVFAGSSDDYRKIAPAYTVIWQAIKEAKQRGCTLFNFGGIQDAVKGHDLGGVTGFKKRFGGYRVDHTNPVDLPFSRLRYALFRLYKLVR